jgi:hypothetical protein
MITSEGDSSRHILYRRKAHIMKKLMSIMLGLSLILGSAAVTFAAPQDDPPKKEKGKKKKEGEEKKPGTNLFVR